MDEFTKLITGITTRLNSLEEKFSTFKADISGRALGHDVKIEHLEKMKISNKNKLDKRVDENSNKINNLLNFEKACNRLDEEIQSLKVNIHKNINNSKIIADGIPVSQNEPVNNDPLPFEYSRVEYGNPTINHDVLFLVDSNLSNMVPSRIKRGLKCASFFCPTLAHIDVFLSEVNIQKQPSTVFIHCGTNLLNNNSPGIDWIENHFVQTIKKVKDMFPNTRIIISSLLPRKEGIHNRSVRNLNDFLYGVCCTTDNIFFMRNMNIKRYMLVDQKHISEEGFYRLMNNIRFTISNK